jgi:hypothetical protein
MRDLVRALPLSATLAGWSSALGAAEPSAVPATPPAAISGEAAWAGEAPPQAPPEFGFAPLSVTQSGVAYSPAAPAFDPAASDEPKIADLPAWASSYFTTGTDRRSSRQNPFGVVAFGVLPEPAAWALVLIGTAMICGALRGLIMANRRLARLRDEDEAPD